MVLREPELSLGVQTSIVNGVVVSFSKYAHFFVCSLLYSYDSMHNRYRLVLQLIDNDITWDDPLLLHKEENVASVV